MFRSMTRPLALGTLLVGCVGRPPPAPAPPANEDEARATEQLTGDSRREPLALPASRFPVAPWLDREPVVPAAASFASDPPVLPTAKSRFVGHGVALARVGEAVFAFAETDGVIGPLALPAGTTWVGVDGKGRVLTANGSGQLFRAPSLAEARTAAAFAPAGSVPAAIAWDVNGQFVAAATVASVALSGDGGASFRELGRVDAPGLVRVLVRSDGVVAAQGVARDRAPQPTWVGSPTLPLRRSPLQPSELERAGDRIVALSPSGPVLSRDGVHFAADATDEDFEATSWTRLFTLADGPAGFTRDLSTSVAAPVPPPPRPGTEPRWSPTGRHHTRAPQVRVGATTVLETRCACAAYLGGLAEPVPPPTRAAFALFGDGRCAAEHEDFRSPGSERCALDAPFLRAPTLALLDRGSGVVKPLRPPTGCQPETLFAAGGIGLLICAPLRMSSPLSLSLVDREGNSCPELTFELDTIREARALSLAPDGTLLLRTGWDTGSSARDPATFRRRAFVRSPLPLGHAEAWREVDVRDAIEVRVDIGGGLLLVNVSRAVPCPGSFDLLLDRPGEPRTRLARQVRVEGTLYDLWIEGRQIHLAEDAELQGNRCGLRREAPAPQPHFVILRDGTRQRATSSP